MLACTSRKSINSNYTSNDNHMVVVVVVVEGSNLPLNFSKLRVLEPQFLHVIGRKFSDKNIHAGNALRTDFTHIANAPKFPQLAVLFSLQLLLINF